MATGIRNRKYPKEIFVVEEPASNEAPYLVVHKKTESAAIVGGEVEAAVYQYVKTVRIKTTTRIL